MQNPDFNYGEFAIIKSQAGLNGYKISVKDWVAKTNAIGLTASSPVSINTGQLVLIYILAISGK